MVVFAGAVPVNVTWSELTLSPVIVGAAGELDGAPLSLLAAVKNIVCAVA